MRTRSGRFPESFVLVAAVWSFASPPAEAQNLGLGGYGAMTYTAPAGMGAGGPIIPYGGSLSGFMPYRMGATGNGVSFGSRNSSAIGSGRISFRMSSIYGGMPMSAAAFGRGTSTRTGSSGSLMSSGGMGLGGGMNRSMGFDEKSVMPPSFGYPFYQPPGLLGPSSAFLGMSSM
jgi:hypothetical protein